MLLNGAEIIVECLKEQGVDTVFGYPGGAALNVYDALYKHSDEINHILTAHEQGASHAADGYSRATGRVGVCIATSGPGATNLVTGIATAYMDSIPMVAITCNVNVNMLGKDTFQEIDICGVTMPITKHNFIVKDVKDLANVVRRAFEIAQTGRPGPVLIDVAKDVTANECEYEKETPKEIKRVVDKIDEKSIDLAIELMKKSKKPFIFVGGGAISAEASEEVNKLAHLFDSPVTISTMGKGAFDETDPLYTGMIGMHGTKTSNFGVSKCDLLFVIGARFSDRVTGNTNSFAKNAKIIQIDVDAAEINKNIMTDVSIVGDAKVILQEVIKRLPQQEHKEWLSEIEETTKRFTYDYDITRLTAPGIIETLCEMTNGDAIVSTDVGQHQMWAAQHYHFKKPRRFLTSGGLGTMGYGIGAAIGAKLGCPDKTVINIGGDGCFRMNMNELSTVSRYDIPIIEIVINNEVLGMVRQWQDLFYQKRYSQTTLADKVNFVKVSEALGVKGYRVTTLDEFKVALKEVLDGGYPAMIECMIGRDDKVFPMVSPGTSILETFDEKDIEQKGGL